MGEGYTSGHSIPLQTTLQATVQPPSRCNPAAALYARFSAPHASPAARRARMGPRGSGSFG